MNHREVTNLIALSLQLGGLLILCQSGMAQKQAAHVSVADLIQNPTKYNGETIIVEGFLLIGSERPKGGIVYAVLIESERDATQFLSQQPSQVPDVPVVPNKEMMQNLDKINRTYVSLVGVVRAVPVSTPPTSRKLYTLALKVQNCSPQNSPRR